MNKPLHIGYWSLIILFILSLVIIAKTANELRNANSLNSFITSSKLSEETSMPSHPLARFALAYALEADKKPQEALDMYTSLLSNGDDVLAAKAYYNRGIINLKQANLMQEGDPKQIPLIELAKQDFRHALVIEPNLWDARFNLEVALNLVPELPTAEENFEKNEISSSRSIEAVGFRVDLP